MLLNSIRSFSRDIGP